MPRTRPPWSSSKPEPNPEHKYVPQFRPVTFASLPEGVRWDYVETPSDGHVNRPDLRVSWHRFGVVMLSRALTDEEMSHFDMKPYTPQPTESERIVTKITMPAPKLDAPKPRSEKSKGPSVIQRIQEMMKQPNGVSEPEVCEALNWKAAGATIMRAIKAADFEVRKFKGDDRRTRYAAVV